MPNKKKYDDDASGPPANDLRDGILGACLAVVIAWAGYALFFARASADDISAAELVAAASGRLDERSDLAKLEAAHEAYHLLSSAKPDSPHFSAAQKEKIDRLYIRKNNIARQFSGWDGEHRALARFVKSRMNDRGSYEHISTNSWDMGDHLIVNMTYSGKNLYNATVKSFVKAKISLEGEVIEIIDEQSPI